VQQGEYLYQSRDSGAGMSELMGYTSCKLELALVPSVISVVGRMLTGDDDVNMELFLFQMGATAVHDCAP
jgi:hypothetical protein